MGLISHYLDEIGIFIGQSAKLNQVKLMGFQVVEASRLVDEFSKRNSL